jgi:hypothetical protein
MDEETPQSELTRLRKAQVLAQEREIYGGFSPAERIEYDNRAKRINELDAQVRALAIADDAASERRRDWNKLSETDTPLSGARQPYRSREKDSTTAYTESLKTDQANHLFNRKADE